MPFREPWRKKQTETEHQNKKTDYEYDSYSSTAVVLSCRE